MHIIFVVVVYFLGLCLEKRVFYRLISGFHTAITVTIAANNFKPGKKKCLNFLIGLILQKIKFYLTFFFQLLTFLVKDFGFVM